jgi:hypothetical protein
VFSQLSGFARDVLVIPAVVTNCNGAFSLAKLTVISQRHSLLGSTVEELQLLKNWIGCVTLGGFCWNSKAGENLDLTELPSMQQLSINQSDRLIGTENYQFRSNMDSYLISLI